MVAPVYKQGATSVAVYFLGSHPWYDVADGTAHAAPSEATVAAPIDKVPVFQRGGSVVPRQMRARRSSSQMGGDPYTLTIAPDATGAASGRLYLDRGDGYEYQRGEYAYRKYAFAGGVLASTSLHDSAAYRPTNTLERIELLVDAVAARKIQSVVLSHKGASRPLEFAYHEATRRLTVRKPDVPMADDWEIAFK